ncbi:MAG TPA: sigma-70 family RNA polymerase sigma factor [Atopostipes sp.]|nr:sigma-70 family RNA polymerase sigma factor [Atopostipes sp.]
MVENKEANLPEVLVLLIQLMKKDPFEKLLELSNPITYSVVKKYFLPDYEREDLIQEARSVLNETINTYDIKAGMGFLQFYHMSLSNHLNMLLRREQTQKRRINIDTVSLDELVEEAGVQVQGVASVTTYPEEMAVAKETFNNYLVELSPFESEVFKLFLDGMTQENIAIKLNIPQKKVRSALYRCSAKLKSEIND